MARIPKYPLGGLEMVKNTGWIFSHVEGYDPWVIKLKIRCG